MVMRACFVLLFVCLVSAQEIELLSPLTTVIPAPEHLPIDATHLRAVIEVPQNSAPDLGAGFFLRDKDGRWFQQACPGPLTPGRHELRVSLANGWCSEPDPTTWQANDRALAQSFGLFCWSADAGGSITLIELTNKTNTAPTEAPAPSLVLNTPDTMQVRTGQRWTCTFNPAPMPANPYNHADFSARLIVSRPDGSEESINAFFILPQNLSDRGDSEIASTTGNGHFAIRYRPRIPGPHRLQLEATWADGTADATSTAHSLPDLIVSGETWDDYVRVDKRDPRFLGSGSGAPFWPIGITINAPQDTRSVDRYHTVLTPHRGTQSYEAYFDRLARAGGNCSEIWLSTWNVGIEWSDGWPGFHGPGMYNQANAARLDRLLDIAWERGIRLVLTLDNHGKGKSFIETRKHDEGQWKWHPYRQGYGGQLNTARELFSHPWAKDMQQRRYRYLMARYADHPAVLTWKLWSEVDLTDLGIDAIRRNRRHLLPILRSWHKQAATYFHDNDIYRHPIATHFATHYRYARPEIVDLPEIDWITIDAYHRPKERWQGATLPDFLHLAITDRSGGLGRHGKPVFATEFGGNHDRYSDHKMAVEQRIGHFGGLVTGHAGAPMFWWHEWIDQRDSWWPYRAISRYNAGEDLRNPTARSVSLKINDPQIWTRAWARPGRLLGYLVCRTWATKYDTAPTHPKAIITISNNAKPGTMRLEWWDADRGVILHHSTFAHPGGELTLPVPTFRRHLAFKLMRLAAGQKQ